jgi:hypothetical protein
MVRATLARIDRKLARAACAALAFVCLGTAAAPAGAAAPREGLQIPAAEFRQQIHTVALMPVMVPPVPGGRERLRERYDSLLVEHLGAAGIRGITARAWSIARQAVIDSVGPAVDEKTGKPDLARARDIVTETRRRIGSRFGRFDAVLSSTIQRSDRGWSLHLEIRDPGDRTLYIGSGEIVRDLRRASGQGEGAPTAPLTTTPERDARAVKSALSKLTKALAPTPARRPEPPR